MISSLWLNEAFATWMADKVVARLYPQYEVDLKTPQNRVMERDADLTSLPIRKPIKSESDVMDDMGLAYFKGGAVLNMVERWLGPETFRREMRTYLNQHRFGNAEAANLWNALGTVSHKDVAGVLAELHLPAGLSPNLRDLPGRATHRQPAPLCRGRRQGS